MALTIQQLQKLKEIENITDPTLKAHWTKLIQLPDELRDVIFSAELAENISALARQYGLLNFQTNYLFTLIVSILSGEAFLDKLTQTLADECVFDEEMAQDLAQQIVQVILRPLQDILIRTHGPVFAEILHSLLAGQKIAEPAAASAPPSQTPSTIAPIAPQTPPNTPPSAIPPTNNLAGPRRFAVPNLSGNVVNLRDLPKR